VGFRLAALMLAVALVVAAEGVCRLTGIGAPQLAPDPFVGFSAIHPLFEVDADRGVHRICPSRREFFAYESFPVTKPERGYRIFCLGGSTVKGEPYSIPTSFTTWLELAINAADDSRAWDVVNCGGISYASYREIPIVEECLRYQPDLFIICTGHNEFLEDRTYGHLKSPQLAVAATQQAAGTSHLVTLAREALDALESPRPSATSDGRPQLGPETDPILDYNDSLKAYHWDDAWRAGVIAHYEFNLRRMIDLAEGAGVPVVLVQPPSNLAGCPPFKSQHHPPLTAAAAARWEELTTAARASYADDLPRSIELLREAVDLSPGHAETLYDLGQCCLAAGRYDEAREWLVQARDNDVVPLRMISELEAAMQRVAAERGVPFLNAHELLESQTPHRILDDSLLVDHIHPGFDGHKAIAAALVRALGELDIAAPRDDWELQARAAWQKHYASIDYTYFAKGQRYLKNLEGWTQGRGDGPPAAQRFPWLMQDDDANDVTP
jgi:tetratricopeptide (TPR) repeat protein